jgi:endoribonuclease Dicer
MASARGGDRPIGSCPGDETPKSLETTLNTLSITRKGHDQAHNEDEDSDADSDVSAHEPKTTSEKRRKQNQILEAFAANISAHVTQEEVKEAASKGINEEQLSIREILAKQETSVRITTPRDYQTELFQRAKRENTIAVLDTGSGKTHIATLLLQHVLDEELASRAGGGVHKLAFFLVRSSSSSDLSKLIFNRSTR